MQCSFFITKSYFLSTDGQPIQDFRAMLKKKWAQVRDKDFVFYFLLLHTPNILTCLSLLSVIPRKKQLPPKKEGEIDPKLWELLLSAPKKHYEKICFEFGVTDFRWMLKRLSQMKKEREDEQTKVLLCFMQLAASVCVFQIHQVLVRC